MIKQLFISILCSMLLQQKATAQSIYSFSVPKIEGGTQNLNAFQNKKLLVITLPVQQTAAADSLLYQLDSLQAANSSTLAIIGVPAVEDGFTNSQQAALNTWYRSKLNTNIVVTTGLYTRKTSGSQQHDLFKWLTTVGQNNSFDKDVTGQACKFFIWTDGSLTSVMGPEVRLSSHVIKDLME